MSVIVDTVVRVIVGIIVDEMVAVVTRIDYVRVEEILRGNRALIVWAIRSDMVVEDVGAVPLDTACELAIVADCAYGGLTDARQVDSACCCNRKSNSESLLHIFIYFNLKNDENDCAAVGQQGGR